MIKKYTVSNKNIDKFLNIIRKELKRQIKMTNASTKNFKSLRARNIKPFWANIR